MLHWKDWNTGATLNQKEITTEKFLAHELDESTLVSVFGNCKNHDAWNEEEKIADILTWKTPGIFLEKVHAHSTTLVEKPQNLT